MRVLFDEATFCSVQTCTEGVLGRLGMFVDVAESAPEAYEKVRREVPDVVVLRSDIGGGGAAPLFQAIRCKLNQRGTTLFGILQRREKDKLDEYLEMGCDEVMLLPVSPEFLMSRIIELGALQCRRSPRIPFDDDIPTRIEDEIITVRARDMSATGLSFATALYIEEGACLVHRLLKTDCGEERALFSRVVRRNYRRRQGIFEYGACFTDLTGRDRTLLRSLIGPLTHGHEKTCLKFSDTGRFLRPDILD
ncbi:PilZ domain-containing protein [Acidobacteriota bacterium]